MSKMSMPGFTADASLRPAGGRYRTLSVIPAPSNAVEPQWMTKQEMDDFMRSLLAGPGVVPPPWVEGGGDGGGSWADFGGNPNCPRCKASCYRKPAGSARQACLTMCDEVC